MLRRYSVCGWVGRDHAIGFGAGRDRIADRDQRDERAVAVADGGDAVSQDELRSPKVEAAWNSTVRA